MDIDQIIANNKKPLSLELNQLRQRVTSETTEFMQKYQEINDEIESEVVDKVLNLYMEYYAALVGYLGVGFSKNYDPKSIPNTRHPSTVHDAFIHNLLLRLESI